MAFSLEGPPPADNDTVNQILHTSHGNQLTAINHLSATENLQTNHQLSTIGPIVYGAIN